MSPPSPRLTKKIPIDLDNYLSKLGVARELPSLSYLKKLQKAHLLHIPLENLDFHLGMVYPLDVLILQRKILFRKRGGVSYELNGLFFQLLLNLGFDCHLISVNLRFGEAWSPDFEHIGILVWLDNKNWLSDVGASDPFIEPKCLKLNQVQVDYTRYFKFEKDPDGNWILLKSSDLTTFSKVFHFSDSPKEYIEFIPRWLWHQSNLDSPFRKQKFITQLFQSGRITLTDRILTLFYKGTLEEIPIRNEDEFLSKLHYHFGIDARKIILPNSGDS